MTNYDIVKKLIGPVYPIGETHEDAKRLENLKELTLLVDKLIFDIDAVGMQKDSHEWSVKEAGKFADKFLDELGIKQ